MIGYMRAEAASREAFAPGGWLRTGDLGVLDNQGGLWLRGRLKVHPLLKMLELTACGPCNLHAWSLHIIAHALPWKVLWHLDMPGQHRISAAQQLAHSPVCIKPTTASHAPG